MDARTHGKLIAALFVVVCVVIAATGQAGAAGVRIDTASAGPTSIGVGEIARVVTRAAITDASGPADGLFSYDLDLIVSAPDASGPPFEVLSIERHGIDPLLGGAAGTVAPFGVDAVAGAYAAAGGGTTAPIDLFTVTFRATAPGRATFTAAPDTDVYGIDLLLHAGSPASAEYRPGVTIIVVPEPTLAASGAGAAAVSTIWFGRRSGRRSRAPGAHASGTTG